MIKFFLLLSFSLPVLSSETTFDVIYGKDNRHDVYSYTNPKVVALSKSTVALVKASDLTESTSLISILKGETFEESASLCSGERFMNQPTGAFCSGFLIAPNKIMTAGHCIESLSDCEDVRFVFDYAMKNASTANLSFAKNQIYSCKKILGRKKERGGLDYAVIELDRVVSGRTPFKRSTNASLKVGTKVMAIGHPSGLPTKITDSAKIRSIELADGYFVTNLDTYGGNSGSAVINEATHEVEGIIVRGEQDFEIETNCQSSYQVGEDEGRGEDVTLISQAIENGFQEEEEEVIPSSTSEVEYIYLDSDGTCNEFRGVNFIREVSMSLCSDAPGLSYVWLDSDESCNEFRGTNYIREVSDSLCNR